jgi:hypothetical protein
MFLKRRRLEAQIVELTARNTELSRMVSALRSTVITYSVRTDQGSIMPVYRMDIESAILAHKFVTQMGGTDMPAGLLDVTSRWIGPDIQYTEPEDGNSRTWGSNEAN